MSDTEFTDFDKLDSLSDSELEEIVIEGVNLHIHMSKASVAKRILENRRQKKHLDAVNNLEKMTKQLENSHSELLSIVGGLRKIVKILEFFERHWLPKQSLWVRVGLFIFGTVLLGIGLNLIADWIAKFIFHW